MAEDRGSGPADEISRDCVAVRLRLLNRVVTGIYDDALRPFGLTAGQLNILVVVIRRGPIKPVKVSKLLCMDKSTLSRNVERMRKGVLLNVLEGEDGRSQLLSGTTRGAQLLDRVLPAWREAQDRASGALGQTGVRAVRRMADAIWRKNRSIQTEDCF